MSDIFAVITIIGIIVTIVILYKKFYPVRVFFGIVLIIIGIICLCTVIGGPFGFTFIQCGIGMIGDK